MKLENHFTVEAPISEVWKVFEDIPRVASCLPGATLTGSHGDEHHGKVTVKVGPMKMTYQGQITVKELDEESHRARLIGQGRDTRGSGKAQADVRLHATQSGDGTSTQVSISTDLEITGRVAQFGRGALQEVSAAIIDDFAGRLAREIQSGELPASGATKDGVAADSSVGAEPPISDTTSAPAEDEALDAAALLEILFRRPSVTFVVGLVIGLLLGRRARPD